MLWLAIFGRCVMIMESLLDAFILYKKSKAKRKPSAPSHPSNANERNSPVFYVFILKSGKRNNVMSDQVLPSLILDDSYISDRDFSLYLMGVGSWFSSLKRDCNSFVSDERIVWISLEGLPLNVWTRNTFAKVASKWGDLVEWEDLAEKSLFCKLLCVKTNLNEIIAERFKVIMKGSVRRSQSGDKVIADNDVEMVSESNCMHNNDLLYDNNHNNIMRNKDKVLSEDPFNLYDILNKRNDSGDDLKYPPGFIPSMINVEEVNKKVKGDTSNNVNEHVNSTSKKLEESVPKGKLSSNNSVCSKSVHIGNSILQLMNELVKV
ncbi:hypothetical protein Tco_0901564 [Tanacetum coccineum]